MKKSSQQKPFWDTLDDSHLFDLILHEVGGLGRYQIFLLLMSLLCSFIAAFNHLSPIYLAFNPKHFECIGVNYEEGEVLNATITQEVSAKNRVIALLNMFIFRCSLNVILKAGNAWSGLMKQTTLIAQWSPSLIWFVTMRNCCQPLPAHT